MSEKQHTIKIEEEKLDASMSDLSDEYAYEVIDRNACFVTRKKG